MPLNIQKMKKLITVGIYLCFFMILFVCMYEKTNLHTDEVSTYVLSNNTMDDAITVNPERGVVYEDPAQAFLDYMTVQEGQQFNYVNVWEKQESDVHPPLYYALVHTICSFFPNMYSKWFAGGINILFALLTLFVMRKLAREISGKESAEFLASCCFIFSAGVLSSTTFLRMYIVTMFFVTLVSYLLLKGIQVRNLKFYISTAVVSLLGSLTHYYFIVYLFFACAVFGMYLLCKKAWKDVGFFCLAVGLAEALAVAIFPSIITHSLGGGYRGEETLNNLIGTSANYYWTRLKTCFSIVDSQLFGGLFIALIGIVVVAMVIGWCKKRKASANQIISLEKTFKWLILWVPVILYFLLISRMAVYLTDRYFHPIYPLLIALMVSTLCVAFESLLSKKIAFVLVAILLMVSTVKDFRENWFYLYRSSQSLLDAAEAHSDKDCIYIINAPYEINPSFYETQNYNSIAFLSKDDLSGMKELPIDADNGLVLSMGTGCNFDVIFQTVQSIWPDLQNYEMLGGHSFSVTYYIY